MDKEKVKVNTDVILDWLKEKVENKSIISRETWLEIAFKLNLLRIDESALYNEMHQDVAKKKLTLLYDRNGKKKSIALVELEIEAMDEFKFLKDQEDKLWSIDEFIRVAKKSADVNF